MPPLDGPPSGNFGGGPDDGLVEPTPAVKAVHASESSRYVVLATSGEPDDPEPDAFLFVERVADEPERRLDNADARRIVELQNGLAYLGSDVESVRVRTPVSRTVDLRCELVLGGFLDRPLAYAGERFELSLTEPPRTCRGSR